MDLRSSPSEIEAKLRKIGPQQQVAVAVRAVLRALPILSEAPDVAFAEARRRLFLVVFRGCALAWHYALSGEKPAEMGYVARDLANFSGAFDSPVIERVCDAMQAVLDSMSGPLPHAECFEAIMDSAAAAGEYAPRKHAKQDLLQAAGEDLHELTQGSLFDLSQHKRLWRARVPAWNSSIWRVATYQLLAAKEGWEPWLNWYEELVGGAQTAANVVSVLHVAGLTETDWKQPLAANAKIRNALNSISVSRWASALDDSSESDAPPIVAAGSQLRFSSSVVSNDAEVALRPGTAAEYANIRRELRALQKYVVAWVTDDCHPDWQGLKADVLRLNRLMPADMNVAVGQTAVLWAAGVAVLEYLDQDRQLRSDPNSGNAPALPLQIKKTLSVFVQIFAGWILEFPTAATREENAQAFGGALERLDAAKRVVVHVRRANVLRKEDLQLLEELIGAASRGGKQTQKAKFWSIATVRRIIFAGARLLATSAVGKVAGDVTESSVLLTRISEMMLQGEAAVLDFADGLQANSKEALIAIIEKLREAPPG